MKRRRALVTGASSGLGLAIATDFLERGIHTTYLARRSSLQSFVAEEARRTGTPAAALLVDLASAEAVRSVSRELATEGNVDILVNCAGINPKVDGRAPGVGEIDADQWEQVLRVNLTAPFLLSQAVLPGMRSRGWGRIVMISSRAARASSALASTSYAATKTGLLGLARQLADEVAADGVTVNTVAPGPIQTPLSDRVRPELRQSLVQSIPVGRYGTAAEVAAAVAYLISNEASFTTGCVLDVNGGSYKP